MVTSDGPALMTRSILKSESFLKPAISMGQQKRAAEWGNRMVQQNSRPTSDATKTMDFHRIHSYKGL